MTPEPEFKPVIWCVFAVVLALSGLALLGWLFDIQFLKSVRGDWISMRVATAMCLAGCAVALAALQRSEDSRWSRRLSRALGVGVALTGLVSLAAYLWAMQFGLEPRWADQALLRGFFGLPSRMAPVTTLIFIGFGSALFLLSSPSPRAAGLAHAILFPAALLSYLVLISYLFDVNSLHTWLEVPVALNTGLACCALSIGLFLVRPGTWFMSVLASPESGGIIARRLLPAVLAAPLVIVWVWFASERAGSLAAPVGAVLLVTANAVVLLWVLWLVARSANLTDGHRRKMEATLQESEERLRFALESCHIGTWDIDLVDHTASRSLEHDRIFGYKELLPQWTLDDFLRHALPEHRAEVETMVREATAAQTGWTYVCPIRRADGEIRWIWFSGRHRTDADASGHPHVVGVVQDITERKQAEEALRESEAKFRNLFENIDEMVTVYEIERDGGGRIVERRLREANPAFLRAVGVSSVSEIRGKTSTEILGEVWSDLHLPAVQKAMDTGDVQVKEVCRPDSGRHYITSVVRFDADTYLTAGWDITERKEAEEALRESEARFRSVVENMSEGLMLFDPRGNLIYQNPASFRIHGFAPQEDFRHESMPVTWQGWDDEGRTVGFEDWPVSRVLRGESFQGQVLRVLRPETGLEFASSYNGCPVYDNQGELALGFITIRDITARRKAEAALRESEEEFRTLANAIPQLCWMTDADGSVLWRNQRWYEYTGTTPEQMEGRDWQWVHDPEALPNVLERWKHSLATGVPFDMVFPLRGGDGVFRPFLTRVMPVRDRHGNVRRWFGTNTDISEQRKVEEALRESSARMAQLYLEAGREIARRERVETELRRSNTDLEQFAFAISHDLRSPLNAITSYARQLDEEYHAKLGGDADTYLTYITGASARLRRLISDLLVYSRVAEIDQSKAGLMDSQEALWVAELNLQERIRAAGATVTHDALPEVVASSGLLAQVFQNLAENAIKFRGEAAPRVHVSASRQGDEWRFCVADNGIGIEPRHLEQVFRVFKRLHGDTYEGTGIGLAICRKIVERQGGRIWVESALGQGARFYFTLPAARISAQVEEASAG